MLIFVIVMALLLVLVAFRFAAVRIGRQYYPVVPLCAALVAALAIFMISSRVLDRVLDQSAGDLGWSSNGFVRGAIILGTTLVVGYWVWIISRSRYPDS